jgi:hypothetical protein
MRIEIENDNTFSPSPVALIVSVVLGISLVVLDDLCTGVWGFYATFLVVQVLVDRVPKTPLPADARPCAEAALSRFHDDYPEARVRSVALRDADAERLIMSIRYERPRLSSLPTARTYYAVRRGDRIVTPEEISQWWPRGLK